MPTDDSLSQAIALIQAGEQAEAQKILHPFILANPHNVEAWLWEATLWNTAGKIRVLEMCLQRNPDSQAAKAALAAILAQPENALLAIHKAETKPARAQTPPTGAPPEPAAALPAAQPFQPDAARERKQDEFLARLSRLRGEIERYILLTHTLQQNFEQLRDDVDEFYASVAGGDPST